MSAKQGGGTQPPRNHASPKAEATSTQARVKIPQAPTAVAALPPVRWTPTIYAAIGGMIGVVFVLLLIALTFAPTPPVDEIVIFIALLIDAAGGLLLIARFDARRRLVAKWRSIALDNVTDYLILATELPSAPEHELKALELRLEQLTEELLAAEAALVDASAYAEAAAVAEARRSARLDALRLWGESQ